MTEALQTTEPVVETPTAVARTHPFRTIIRNPLGLFGVVVLTLVILLAIFAPIIAPFSPTDLQIDKVNAAPGGAYVLGGDGVGRDILSRLLWGSRNTLLGAIIGVSVAMVLGITSGLLGGYYGGWADGVFAWVTNILMALPTMIVLLAVFQAVGSSIMFAMVAFGVMVSPGFYRLVRGQVMAVKNELYVDAARVSGLTDARIIGRHILLVVRAPVIIQAAHISGIAIIMQSGLEFLGLGDPSLPTWGGMLQNAFANIYNRSTSIVWPGLAIGFTVAALMLLGNAVRDTIQRTAVIQVRPRAAAAPGLATSTDKLPLATEESVATETARSDATSEATLDGATDASLADAPERMEGAGAAEAELDESMLEPEVLATAAIAPVPMRLADPQDPDLALCIRGLTIGYPQGDDYKRVVEGVSLDVRKGEVLGLVGESGSGKTQTAFACLGLLPPGGTILSGSIQLGGQELVGLAESSYRKLRGRDIAYVPQEPMSNLDPCFRVGFQLVEPLKLQMGMSAVQAKTEALALLERVGIPDPNRTFNAYPHEISGGMAQRVLIAGAVSCHPQLLIADEPTTALDVTVQAEVLDLLRDLQKDYGMSVLLVTHNFGVVADICHRVAVMQLGRIVEMNQIQPLFDDPRHPYTQMLLSSTLEDSTPRPFAAQGSHR